MTALLEGAKKLVSRGSDTGARVAGLAEAVEGSRGRLPDAIVDPAAAVVVKAGDRLRLSADHTVVALAGATGSGKSSTFNALTELDLSAVGVRRPTTSWTTACVWGGEGAQELLEWLGIPARHQVSRDSMLSKSAKDDAMAGVILLDLPDHDSTEVSHHLEVDRLVNLADLLVWVLDPQKYADAAIHERYLQPLSTHEGVMLVVLNQIDKVAEDRRQAMVDDVKRLLVQDGLNNVPVIPVSAREGWGLDELRSAIAKRVAAKKASRDRAVADIKSAAAALQAETGAPKPPKLAKERVAALDDAFAEAAGVPTVVKAVEQSTRRRANAATGWPVVSWVSKLKPDPLKRLHLDLGEAGKMLTGNSRTSLPQATRVERARVDTEVRGLADQVSFGLSPAWTNAIRRASTQRLGDLNDRLDTALSSTDLGVAKLPIWANLLRVVQWLLIVAAVVGGLWLAAIAFGGYLQLPELPTPSVPGMPGLAVPTALLGGGIALGILLSLLCRILVSATARKRARTADRRLRAAISEVSDELVVQPVQAELAAYAAVQKGLAAALK